MTIFYFLQVPVFKGAVSRDFRPSVFSFNCTPGSPDSWAKTILHIDSNSRINSTTKIHSALCRIARSRFFLLDNAKLKILFYCHGAGKITYDRFLIDCYFNGFCKGRGPRGTVQFNEKTEGRKSRDTVTLRLFYA
jgi:hypothetical protein